MVKGSPFSIRDTIQYILPMLVGAALFSPYFASVERLEFVFLSTALFSYVLYTPFTWLSRRVYEKLPGLRGPVRKMLAEQRWWAENWDYDRLFYQKLDEKEREYLYSTTGYAAFHRLSSFFLLCFTVVQVLELIFRLPPSGDVRKLALQAWAVRTEMVGGWDVPTLVAIIVGGILFWTSFNDYLSEARDLIKTYVGFAAKYQKSDPHLARGIWGFVTHETTPVSGASVVFTSLGGEVLAKGKTDGEGRFQLPTPITETTIGHLRAESDTRTGTTPVVGGRGTPQYTIQL